ncbi:MAG: hypothetical protein ACTHKJ_07790 [Candidatus Nitrosocosmicus sp.]
MSQSSKGIGRKRSIGNTNTPFFLDKVIDRISLSFIDLEAT